MRPIQSILCPTDFSECSLAVLDDAIGLAQRFEAKLTLIHVYQLPAYSFAEPTLLYNGEILKALESEAKRSLDKLKQSVEARLGRPVAAKVQLGAPYAEIVDEARQGDHDLIVIGTHGRTGLKHLLIGSVAERVVQLAPCRVLVVRGVKKA
jgi:nucleotide-binding universal stress UspA family protein